MAHPEATCWGMAYSVSEADWDEVLRKLDQREQGGYVRLPAAIHFGAGAQAPGFVYIATQDNPNYLGPCELTEIAHVVRRSCGPSGANSEYVLRLAQALDALGVDDPHVSELARLVMQGDVAAQS